MKPLKLLNATATLGKGQDEYEELDVVESITDGAICQTSVWEPSEAEIEALKNGGRVQLSVLSCTHPPVMIVVQDPELGIVGS